MRDFFSNLDFSDGWGAIATLFLILGAVGAVWKWGGSTISRMRSKPAEAPDDDDGTDFAALYKKAKQPQNWEIRNDRGQLYYIRNLGPTAVTGLRFDEGRIDCLVRSLPHGVALAINQSHEFMLIGTSQTGGPPREIWVWTDQEPSWTAIPIS